MRSLQFSRLALFGRGHSVTLFRTNEPFLRITNRRNDGDYTVLAGGGPGSWAEISGLGTGSPRNVQRY